MSGRHALSVCVGRGLGPDADERLNDACLVFSELLVRMAGAVIAGAKPAAIFSIPMRAYCGGRWRQLERRTLDEALRAYAEVMPAYGVSLAVLYRSMRRVYLLVWRQLDLGKALGEPENASILHGQGYQGTTCKDLLIELRRRLLAYYLACDGGSRAEFPHEIGVFLGYPAEDVRGFMAGRQPTCRGPWCSYGDEESARQRFRLLEACERHCRSRFAAGEPLHALFA